MQAAHDAAGVPLDLGNALDRLIGAADVGIHEDVEVDTGDRDDPVKEIAERAKEIERIPGWIEGFVEGQLDPFESDFEAPLESGHGA